jgi:hypothetical protein
MHVWVGDRFGNVIAELQPDVGAVSWILNGIGRTTLTLTKSDPKTTAENLQIGNRVYIDFDNGLPPWGGVVDLPQRWEAGKISVACYGIEQLLKTRVTRKNNAFYDRPAGEIFSDLLWQTEQKDSLGITIGSVWNGGRSHWPRYHYKSLWNVLTDSLRKIEQCDFRFIPILDAGVISFRAEFYQVAGADKTSSVALVEGGNVASGLTLEEQGTVVNNIYAVGSGSTWGTERLAIAARESDSVARYGLREIGVVYSSVSEQATLEMHARNALAQQSEPRRIFGLPVTNDEPGTFAAYDLGDSLRCVLQTYGFGGYDGTLRVIAREFDPGAGTCKLAVEEQNEADVWIYQDEPEEEV